MNQLLRFLAANSWLLIPVIIGLINVAVRVKQKAAEQKSRRDAANEIARRKSEALRTGRPIDPVIVYDEQPQDAQAQRKARIEALRQQRMQQLQALREKRAGTTASPAASSPPSPGTPRPNPPYQHPTTPSPSHPDQPARRTARVSQPRASAQTGSIAPKQKALKTKMPTLKNTGRPPRPVPKSPSVTPVRRPRVAATDLRENPRAKQVVARQMQDSPSPSLIQPVGKPSAVNAPKSLLSARDLLRNKAQVRQAIIVREILDTPVAMQRLNTGPGSMAI